MGPLSRVLGCSKWIVSQGSYGCRLNDPPSGSSPAPDASMVSGFVWNTSIDTAEKRNKKQALEMRLWKWVKKIFWSGKVSNKKVLRSVGDTRMLAKTINRCRKNWIGHVLESMHAPALLFIPSELSLRITYFHVHLLNHLLYRFLDRYCFRPSSQFELTVLDGPSKLNCFHFRGFSDSVVRHIKDDNQ